MKYLVLPPSNDNFHNPDRGYYIPGSWAGLEFVSKQLGVLARRETARARHYEVFVRIPGFDHTKARVVSLIGKMP